MVANNPLHTSAKIVAIYIVVPHCCSCGDDKHKAVVEEKRIEKLQETPNCYEDPIYFLLLVHLLLSFCVSGVYSDCDKACEPKKLENYDCYE